LLFFLIFFFSFSVSSGFVCSWKDLDRTTNCCHDTHLTDINRFSCDYCNETVFCCSVYEYCVSCCMYPGNVSSTSKRFLPPTLLLLFSLFLSFYVLLPTSLFFFFFFFLL
jgi:hypothetical protein